MLWRHVYKDYYSSRSEIFQDSDENLLLHLSKPLQFLSFQIAAFTFQFISHFAVSTRLNRLSEFNH